MVRTGKRRIQKEEFVFFHVQYSEIMRIKNEPVGGNGMNDFLNQIRQPIQLPPRKKVLYSTLLFLTGVLLGVISKVLDTTPSNNLPYFLEIMDLRNFFSRIGVWIFLAVLISLYSKSPVRAAVNVCLFFIGMIGSYYLYTIYIASFFPKSYMMIWISLTILSPFLAFLCWYAKGKGKIAIFISAMIFLVISRQTFTFGMWYFDVLYRMELLLWLATIFMLYQTPKQMMKVVFIGMLLYFVTSSFHPLGGLL